LYVLAHPEQPTAGAATSAPTLNYLDQSTAMQKFCPSVPKYPSGPNLCPHAKTASDNRAVNCLVAGLQ